MHHSKELAFTFIMMLVFSRCTVSFNNYSSLHTTGWFSCNRIIIIFKSESFKPRIFITTTYNCIEFLLFVTYNVHLNVIMATCCVDSIFKAQCAFLMMSLKWTTTSF